MTNEARPTIAEIVVGDDPDSWRAGGFAVDDDGTCRVGTVRLALVGRADGKRIRSWSLRDATPGSLDTGELDGLPTTADERGPLDPAAHPNGVRSIDHVVLATGNPARTTGAFERVGLVASRVRHTDSYGAPMSQTFFRAGEVIVELIGPDDPPPDGADGPAAFFGLAYTVDDLDTTAALLADHLGTVKDAVQPGRRIVTLRHKELDMSVATAFMSPEPGDATSR
ncbi:MAG TPA: VOC family protein [Acidimicrobiales bacterium]|nr:VOC family protein [Acidimicrobiales bacterium]